MPKKNKELKYEKIDRVERWNYCQRIAKHILDCSLSNEELKDVVLELQDGVKKLNLIIQ